MSPRIAQGLDLPGGGLRFDLEAVPTAGRGFASIGHGLSSAPSARLVQQEAKIPSRQASEAGRGVDLNTEIEALGVKFDCRVDVVNYITHAYRIHSCIPLLLIGLVIK